MKKKFLAVFLAALQSACGTEVAISMVGNRGLVPPSASMTTSLVMTGLDKPHVWANGVDLGIIGAPFSITYTSLGPGQTNVIVVEYCDFIGRIGTNTFYTTTGSRTYSRIYSR